MKRALLATALLSLPFGVLTAADSKSDYLENVTVVNLNGEARRTVTPDKMTANMAIEREAKDATAAQAYVNEKMQLAKVAAGDVAGVKFETGGYSTYQTYPPQPADTKQKPQPMWRARQDVTLLGGKPEDLTKLVARLQQMGFATQSLGYTLSQEKSDQVREELMTEALDSIKVRAQKIAAHLGLKSVRYAVINTSGDVGGPIPMMRTMAMKAGGAMDAAESMPSPVVTPGTTDVQLTVNAEVHMR